MSCIKMLISKHYCTGVAWNKKKLPNTLESTTNWKIYTWTWKYLFIFWYFSIESFFEWVLNCETELLHNMIGLEFYKWNTRTKTHHRKIFEQRKSGKYNKWQWFFFHLTKTKNSSFLMASIIMKIWNLLGWYNFYVFREKKVMWNKTFE